MAFGTGNGGVIGGEVRYSFSWEPDFGRAIVGEWSTPHYVALDAGRWMGISEAALYPVLLDATSPTLSHDPNSAEDGLNYALVGTNASTLGLYFVTTGSKSRNILRHAVRFSVPTGPPPPPPPPTNHALVPMACLAIQVDGAGTTAANGVYQRDTNSGTPVFSKDSGHQLYAFGDPARWKIAHDGVAGSELYYSRYVNTTMPSVAGWRLHGGQAPAPKPLRCVRRLA